MLHLIDASVFVFRAWFSIPDAMRDPEGNPTNAVYGFARFLTEFLSDVHPEHVGVAFDVSLTKSYRNQIYPEYKANRDPAPPELKKQFEWCREVAGILGLEGFSSTEFEADDLIGTLAERFRNERLPIVILTRDKDLSQLIAPGDVYWDYANDKRIAHGAVAREFGVVPERMADFLALMGDAVDNIPGVPGVGRKTATVLMQHFESIDALYAGLDEVAALNIRGASKLADRLREHEPAARLAQRLTEIHTAVPLEVSLGDLRWEGPDLEAFDAFADARGFGSGIRNAVADLAG
jgi:5'-3' exonuclease